MKQMRRSPKPRALIGTRKTLTELDPCRSAGPHVQALRSPERQRNATGCTRSFCSFHNPFGGPWAAIAVAAT